MEDDRPAGRLVRVGHRSVHVLDRGSPGAGPTVVFESGLASPLQSWTWVQEAVGRQARTISYERAGTGWSTPGRGRRTVPRLAAELHELLTALEVHEPIVLVGHSFGGLVVRCFAGTYPERVAGAVFVDALHPEELRRSATQRRGMAWLEQSLTTSALQSVLRLGNKRIAAQFTELPEAAARQARARLGVPGVWRAAAAELVSWKNGDPRDVATGTFPPHVPLGVVVSGESLRNDVAHRKLQDELLTWSADSFAVLAEEASHFGLVLDRTHSHVVVDTIGAVLAKVATRRGERVVR
ncbi:alpha/beta fold hydrolase [Prauserella oleivorans]|uniref:Alpha/beta fold hydrolase n=1 Tax=Prauserella oleivorans TaxID=1478153 RepID=A0ABW5W724_9PSEU